MAKTNSREMEKRQSLRLEKTLPVKFDLPHLASPGGSFEALSRNIGEGGVFVETDLVQDESLSLGKSVILNLELELLGHRRRIRPKGEIAWVSRKSRSPQKKRNGFGVRFIQINSQEKRAISLFISKEMILQIERVEKEIPAILREEKLSDRQRRNLVILNSIRKSRLISRAEISKLTNINIVTVSNYIDNYLKKGLVFERGLDISTGGRRPELIEINPQYGYILGLELNCLSRELTEIRAMATDFTARVKVKEKENVEGENIDECLAVLKELIAEISASTEIERENVRGIGIGISGIMDKFGGTVRNPHTGSTFANYVMIKKELEQAFDIPVFIENSGNCALFAEKWSGVSQEARAADNILYIFSEHQCAIMLKGELYGGSSKSAGQLNLSRPRNNYQNGNFCWMRPESECVFCLGAKSLISGLKSKEEAALAGIRLGAKIGYLVNLFNPQVVIIGARLSQLGGIFLDAIRQTVNRWAFREGANIVRIIPAALGEESVALGAASLVIESVVASI